MKPSHKYATTAAFRTALEDRLKSLAQTEAIDLQRLQRQVAFDRLLGRLFAAPEAPWLLKGGYAMELRMKAARATKDIDLALRQTPAMAGNWYQKVDAALELLEAAGQSESPDFFTYVFGGPTQALNAAPYGGARFSVEARLAGRTFARFHLDVSTGDVLREPYEILEGRDWLDFAGIPSTKFPAVSPEEQFAEKLHAYTLPRTGRENTRVKDLVDLVLLTEKYRLNHSHLPRAIRDTFDRRKTHPAPGHLRAPPVSWAKVFAEMAAECRIEPDMEQHFARLQTFISALGK